MVTARNPSKKFAPPAQRLHTPKPLTLNLALRAWLLSIRLSQPLQSTLTSRAFHMWRGSVASREVRSPRAGTRGASIKNTHPFAATVLVIVRAIVRVMVRVIVIVVVLE